MKTTTMASLICVMVGVAAIVWATTSNDAPIGNVNLVGPTESNNQDFNVNATEEELLGKVTKEGIRSDILPWIKDQKLPKAVTFSLINVALADQKIFTVYQSSSSSSELNNIQSERVFCLMKMFKSAERAKFVELLGSLRMRTFNNESRINAYHQYSRIKGDSHFVLDQENAEKVCVPYSKEVVSLN